MIKDFKVSNKLANWNHWSYFEIRCPHIYIYKVCLVTTTRMGLMSSCLEWNICVPVFKENNFRQKSWWVTFDRIHVSETAFLSISLSSAGTLGCRGEMETAADGSVWSLGDTEGTWREGLCRGVCCFSASSTTHREEEHQNKPLSSTSTSALGFDRHQQLSVRGDQSAD